MLLNLPNFQTARILVLGDVMLDRYWSGSTSRISPEAPVPIVRVKDIEERPGGAANVALNIAHLGAKVALLAYIGDDEAGSVLENILQTQQVDTHFIRLKKQPTITKLRVLSRHQQLMRLDFEENFYEINHTVFMQKFAELLPTYDVIVLSDYKKGTLEQSRILIQLAKSKGKKVIVDPKHKDFSHYTGADLITPNLQEFTQAVGGFLSEQELIAKGLQLMQQTKLAYLLITRSEAGMTLLSTAGKVVNLPTQAQDVYDVTGAGDTVVATLATSWATGLSVKKAMTLANVAAGLVVAKVGTATVSTTELRCALQQQCLTYEGVVSKQQLLQAMQDATAKKEKIVMTNGCFDLLHAGHVAYLQQAKSLGDRLIVAVNSDESVARLKGKSRPITALKNRMTVLAALDSVDWVVDFAEDTPESLICEVKPDLLVKGGDYHVEEIAGRQCVKEVVVLKFVEGLSTSQTINKIRLTS